MIRTLRYAVPTVALFATAAPQLSADDAERLNAFFEQAFDDELSRHPMEKSSLGIKTDYDKWDDLSDAAALREYLINTQLLTTLRTEFDCARLSDKDKLSFRLFELRCRQVIDDYPWRFHTYPVDQMRGWQSSIPAFLVNTHRVTSVPDAEAYVARLRGIRPLLAEVVANVESCRDKGIVPPAFVFPQVLQDCRNLLTGKPFDESAADSPLLEDFRQKVNALAVADEQKKQLLEAASFALVSDVEPAYRQLISFLEQLQSAATQDDGAWKFPNGEEFYRHALRTRTTTDMTPEEIHNLGLSEVERIQNEMRGIMQQVKFTGSLQDFFQFTRTDPQFYYSNDDAGREQYLQKMTGLIDAMRGRLDELFLTKPKADMVVKRVEPFREKSAGLAFYQPAAPDGSRPGTCYVNLANMSAVSKCRIEALAYHEGIPGHHMQLSIAQELEGLPRFRRFGVRFSAYHEGWGLYTELIPKEIGCYTDPYSDFGRLSLELWRATRLVVDTGIHSKRWTRQQAIDYLLEQTPAPEEECRKEIERYIVMPGQATAYKIGMLKILDLRQRAQDKLGDQFDLREFHDVILRDGPLPLTLLEEQVEAWLARRQTAGYSDRTK
jgi:uncharacterized protein (DUF885 family)